MGSSEGTGFAGITGENRLGNLLLSIPKPRLKTLAINSPVSARMRKAGAIYCQGFQVIIVG